MAILDIKVDFIGEIGTTPRIVRIYTKDSFDHVTSANYLQSTLQQGFVFYPNDMACVTYGNNVTQFFTFAFSGGNITLVPVSGNVELPVTDGYFAVFDGTTGNLKAGAATATNPGNIHAGASGIQGNLVAYPEGTTQGAFKVAATDSPGNYNTTITNDAMAQTTVISIPDPGAATAKFAVAPSALVNNNLIRATGTAGLIADAGARIISNTTSTYAGGGTSNAFATTGLTSAAKGSCVIRTSTNNVSIVKAVPGTNTLTVTFSADPGAGTTVDYIYTTAAMT